MIRYGKISLISFAIFSVLLAILVVHRGSGYYSPSSSLSGESSPRILGSTSYVLNASSNVRFLVVEGVVENLLNVNVKVNVTATFYDALRSLIGNLTSPPSGGPIKPGQKAPFTFYWPINSTDVTYELSLSYEQTSEQLVDVLEFRNVTSQTENSSFAIRGSVWNGRPFKALTLSVVCIRYNSGGSFVGLTRTSIPSIDPGGLGNFTIEMGSSVEIASYELVVYAGSYELRSIVNYVLFSLFVLAFLTFVVFMKRRGW